MRHPIAAAMLMTIAVPGMAKDRNQVPEATPVGKPVSCIPLRQIRQSSATLVSVRCAWLRIAHCT